MPESKLLESGVSHYPGIQAKSHDVWPFPLNNVGERLSRCNILLMVLVQRRADAL
jgi:hypothetical protein